jgi:hypothetical protein
LLRHKNMNNRITNGIKAIQSRQDVLDPKAWGSLSAIGPVIAGISWAFSVYLNVPTGYAMLTCSCAFALVVATANLDQPKIKVLGCFVVAGMILFWQAALASTAALVATNSVSTPVAMIDLIVPSAYAGENNPSSLWTAERIEGGWRVTRHDTGVTQYVSDEAFRAIRLKEKSLVRGFGVKFKR